jgi:hypothetical protein
VWVETSAGDSGVARVVRASTDGWDPHPLTGFEPITAVAFDGAAAYVAEGGDVLRVDLETGVRQPLASEPGASIVGMAVDDTDVTFVAWMTQGQQQPSLARVPKNGGTTIVISTQGTSDTIVPVGDVAASGSQVYWSVGGYAPRILGVPDDGGACASIATTEGTATMLRPHGDWVYFTSWDIPTPSMYRMPSQGGTPALVVPMFGTAGYPTPGYHGTASIGAIALDDTNVYFGGFDGTDVPAVFCVAQ